MKLGSVCSKVVCTLIGLNSLIATAETKKAEKINFCIHTYREELAASTALIGKNMNFFSEKGIELKVLNEKNLVKYSKEHLLKNSNLVKRAAEKNMYAADVTNELNIIENLVNTKKCDIVALSLEAMVFSKKSNKVMPIAIYMYGNQYDTSLLAKTDSNINNINDLVGKKVRLGRTSTYIAFENLLKKNDVKIENIQLVRSSLQDTETKMVTGDYDAVIAYVPTIPLMLSTGKYKVVQQNLYTSSSSFKVVPKSGLYVTDNFFKKRKQLLNKFISAYQKSEEYLKKNPEELIYGMEPYFGKEVYGKYTEVEVEKASLTFGIPSAYYFDTRYDYNKNSEVDQGFIMAGIKEYEDRLYEAGAISKRHYHDNLAEKLGHWRND